VLQQHSQAAHAQHFTKKGRPKFLCRLFWGGGFNPQTPPLWLRACSCTLANSALLVNNKHEKIAIVNIQLNTIVCMNN